LQEVGGEKRERETVVGFLYEMREEEEDSWYLMEGEMRRFETTS
jgi:hypothetical protein